MYVIGRVSTEVCIVFLSQCEDVCGGQEQSSGALVLHRDTDDDGGTTQGKSMCQLVIRFSKVMGKLLLTINIKLKICQIILTILFFL